MEADGDAPRPQDETLFDGQLLVEIEAWEGGLHVGLCSDLTPEEERFQGGLAYLRSFILSGRVVAPKSQRGRSIQLWVNPVGPEVRFGPEDLDEVGQIQLHSREAPAPDFRGSLFLPESGLLFAATCLSTNWKYLNILTFDERDGHASVSAFSFSSIIHKSLEAWVARD
jgi:hypothetical protein